jgi:DNA-binding response OmpR family regulator
MPRVLVIEDEPKLRRALERGLGTEGYHVTTAADGNEGSRLARAEPFDCLVLDWMLPGRDGLRVIAELRRAGRAVPVLLLTARDAVQDRVAGLDAGADDYLVKPFAFAELLARVRVLIRGRGERETVLCAADLQVDLLERRALRGEVEVPLTPREFEVLAYLLRHKNHTVTRDMLGREVWREADHSLTNVIDVTMNSLRRKLERAGLPPLIHTLRGRGYSLRDEPCDSASVGD